MRLTMTIPIPIIQACQTWFAKLCCAIPLRARARTHAHRVEPIEDLYVLAKVPALLMYQRRSFSAR
jgi:hypothetical protein